MLHDRIVELERQVAELMQGGFAVAARADGSPVVTSDTSTSGRAIRLVLSDLRKEVPYDSCSVQELRGSRLVIIGGVGFADLDVLLGESFEVDGADIPNSEVIHRKRSLIVGNTDQYRAFRRGLHVGANIFSWLGVPLIHQNRLLGMLALDKAEVDFYSAIHAQTAQAYAGLVAGAMAWEQGEAAASIHSA